MTHEANLAPKDPSVRLAEAKDDFRNLVLADEVSFAVLSRKLFASQVSGAVFPAIRVEPTLRQDEETATSYLGFRIDYLKDAQEAEAHVSVRQYEHLNVGSLDMKSGKAWPSDELRGLLKSAGREIQDGLSVFQTWQRGAGEMAEKIGNETTLDPDSHTFELTSIVERTVRLE